MADNCDTTDADRENLRSLIEKLNSDKEDEEEEKEEKEEKSSSVCTSGLARQLLATLCFCLVNMLLGMAHGHSAIMLRQLESYSSSSSSSSSNDSTDLRLENGEFFDRPQIRVESIAVQSWIASSMVLFMVPGCWILAICNKFMGRKPLSLLAIGLFTLSWAIIVFSDDAYHILVGRCVGGLFVGILAGLVHVYQGECCAPKLRSSLNVALSVSFNLGIGFCHAVGTWFHWRTTAAVCGLVGVATLIANCFVPESPVWLLNRGETGRALRSWSYLRGTGRDLDELESMYARRGEASRERASSRRADFAKPTFWKPLAIIILIFVVTQATGTSAVTFYCIQMIADVAGAENAYVGTLILDAFRVLSTTALFFLSRRFSTRVLLLYAAFGAAVFLLLLATSIKLNVGGAWLSLCLLFAYELTMGMGLGPLPWTFCCELFSGTTKETGIGLVTSFNYVLFFAVVKANPYLFVAFETWGTFLLYGLLTFVGTIALYKVLPDTRNKSLKQIELMFEK